MAFSFLAYLFSFRRYLRFCIISGTSNVHHKRNRMTANFRVLFRESAIVKAATASAEYKSKHQSSGKNLATWKSALSIMILSRSSSCYLSFLV